VQHLRAQTLRPITSSARASSVGGTIMPSALAILRLITRSYLVGACTGRSAGFSPLRMRSTYPVARRQRREVLGALVTEVTQLATQIVVPSFLAF
jgi:hypothetical protein